MDKDYVININIAEQKEIYEFIMSINKKANNSEINDLENISNEIISKVKNTESLQKCLYASIENINIDLYSNIPDGSKYKKLLCLTINSLIRNLKLKKEDIICVSLGNYILEHKLSELVFFYITYFYNTNVKKENKNFKKENINN